MAKSVKDLLRVIIRGGGIIGGDTDAKKNQATTLGGGIYVSGGTLNIDGDEVYYLITYPEHYAEKRIGRLFSIYMGGRMFN